MGRKIVLGVLGSLLMVVTALGALSGAAGADEHTRAAGQRAFGDLMDPILTELSQQDDFDEHYLTHDLAEDGSEGFFYWKGELPERAIERLEEPDAFPVTVIDSRYSQADMRGTSAAVAEAWQDSWGTFGGIELNDDRVSVTVLHTEGSVQPALDPAVTQGSDLMPVSGFKAGGAPQPEPAPVPTPTSGPGDRDYPAARGWSVSELGLRVTGPDMYCTYLFWLSPGAPAERVAFRMTRGLDGTPSTTELRAGAPPKRIKAHSPCTSPGQVTVSTGDVTETFNLPQPRFRVDITEVKASIYQARVTGTITNNHTMLSPVGPGPHPGESEEITSVRAYFLDRDKTTADRCAWLGPGGRSLVYSSRASDPTCQRPAARVGIYHSTGASRSWTGLFVTRGHRGRLMVINDSGAIRLAQTIERAPRPEN